jgi:hypothetical protein
MFVFILCDRMFRLASTCVEIKKKASKNVTKSKRIIKSPLDKREYRGLILPNQMKVLLISDPLTDKAAASLSVAAGKRNIKTYELFCYESSNSGGGFIRFCILL